jgi:2-hydroxy-3-oxopropionate reductase
MTALAGQVVGFIGLGLMGRAMTRNLLGARARLLVYGRNPEVVAGIVAQGAVAKESPAAVAGESEAVILMVTDTPAVETVLLGAQGIIEGLHPGTLVIDMGTTAATATRRFAERVRAAGGDYVDAPVSGGEIGAQDGTLSIMAGGSEAAVGRARPILEVLGRRITHVGPVGAGQVAKAANQIIVGLTIGAIAEGLTLARRAGVDPARVREALSGGFADSRILEVHGKRMIENEFAPGAHCTVQQKDLSQALELAGEFGLDLPATRLCRDLYDRVIAQGYGRLDHAALIKVLEEG